MLPTISRASLQADRSKNAKLASFYDGRAHNVGFNIYSHACFDFTASTALEML